jgi:hypothetical protein
MKIDLDRETADRVTHLNLKEHASILKKVIKDLKSRSSLNPFEQEDLTTNIQDLAAINQVIDIFSTK